MFNYHFPFIPSYEFEAPYDLIERDAFSELENAIANNDPDYIVRCLSEITNFSSLKPIEFLNQIEATAAKFNQDPFVLYRAYFYKGACSYLKSMPDISKKLEMCFNEHPDSQSYLQTLIEIALVQKDAELLSTLVEWMNEKKIPSALSLKEKMLSYLGSLPLEEVLYLNPMFFELIVRNENKTFSSTCNALERFKGKEDFYRVISYLLHGAYEIQSKALLFDCLKALYTSFHPSILAKNEPEIYRLIYAIRPSDKISNWVRSCLLQVYLEKVHTQTSFEEGRRLISFLCFYSKEHSEENLIKTIEPFIKGRQRSQLVKFLLLCTSSEMNEKILSSVFKLIINWKLYEDAGFCCQLISLIAQFRDYPNFIKNCLQTIHSFPCSSEQNPLHILLEEFLQKLPADQWMTAFELLDFGIHKIEDLQFVELCLDYIDTENIHSFMPLWADYRKLLYEGKEQITRPFSNDAVVSVEDEGGQTVFQIPLAILKMRAPNFEEAISNSSYNLKTIQSMLKFIINPYDFKIESIEQINELYGFAAASGATQFLRMAHEFILKQKIQSSDIPVLLNIYPFSFGKFRREIRDLLLNHAFVELDPSLVSKIFNGVQSNDPDAFLQIKLNSTLRLEDKAVLLTHAPNLEELDLQNCLLKYFSLNEIIAQFTNLKRLTFNCENNRFQSLAIPFSSKKLKHLKIINPSKKLINACSNLPLETLELIDLSYGDRLIEMLFNQKNLPLYFKTLHTLNIGIEKGVSFKEITDEGACKLIPHLHSLKNIYLDGAAITPKTLKTIFSFVPELNAFSLNMSLHNGSHGEKIELKEVALNNFIKNYPMLTHFSFRGFVKDPQTLTYVKETLFDTINDLEALKSLHFQYLSDEHIPRLVDKHPELEVLDLSGCNITRESIQMLSSLKQLNRLNLVKTNLSFSDILELTEELPLLKSLKIQLPKSIKTRHEHQRIADVLALRGIDVEIGCLN